MTDKPKGTIRYVLLVVSHPTAPTPSQSSKFLIENLPELDSQHDDNTKIGQLWKTDPMSSIDMTALAVEAFGHDFSDNRIYTYRTVYFGLHGGEAKILIAYKKKKWWQFWR